MATATRTRGARIGSRRHLQAAYAVKGYLGDARRARGLSRREAATRFGVSRETLRRWEDAEAPQDPRPGSALDRAAQFVEDCRIAVVALKFVLGKNGEPLALVGAKVVSPVSGELVLDRVGCGESLRRAGVWFGLTGNEEAMPGEDGK